MSQAVKNKTFNIDIIETGNLDLKFTWITPGQCTSYIWQFPPSSRVGYIMRSKETSHYLEAMFPVARMQSSFLKGTG